MRRTAGSLVLARRWPPRFDAVAEATFPPVRRSVLAHEIRKDLWRLFRQVKGLTPVVEVTDVADGLRVRAGARIEAATRTPAVCSGRIADLLGDPAIRSRWIAHAGRRSG